MMRRIFMMTMLVYVLTLAQTASAQVTDVDVTTALTLRPIEVTASDIPQNLRTLRRKYGIPEPSFDYHLHAGEDPNLAYRRARPFPEMGLEGAGPLLLFNGPTTHSGVKRVEAWRFHWPWPPPSLRGIPEEEKQSLWSWEVPKPLQNRWWTEAPGDGADRYWALCLYTGLYARKPLLDPDDPQLFYFDTLSGLRWQATIPVRKTLEQIPTSPGAYAGDAEVLLGIADGSRVLALVSRPDKHASLLYVFDGKGKLLRTLRFPDYTALWSGNPSWQLRRSPSGRTHLLYLRRRFVADSDESCLIDSDGRLLARFVSDEGQSVQVTQLSDKYVLAERVRPDGHYWQYIYQLP